MATDYKMEFKDVHGSTWRVWIRDTYIVPLPYGLRFWEDAHNEGSGFYVNFWCDSAPVGAAYAVFMALPKPVANTQYTTQINVPISSSPPKILLPAGNYNYYVNFYNSSNGLVESIALNQAVLNNNVVELKAAKPALVLKNVNNSDDKLNPVRATECVISFLNEGTVNLATFAGDDSNDNRWKVEVEYLPYGISPTPGNWQKKFDGFLQLDDTAEPLLDPVNVVKLTATDKLGALKDVPLRNFSGGRYFGIAPIITYIAMALAATGLVLGIKTCANAEIEGQGNLFEKGCIDSRTFDTNIYQAQDCYTVLSKLLAPKYFITQHEGFWWIMDVANPQPGNNVRVYSYDGKFLNTESKTTLKLIGRAEPLKLINADAQVQLARPAKQTKVEYKYSGPEDNLDNEKYNAGAFFADENTLPLGYMYTSKDIYESKITYDNYTKKIFTLNGWTLYKRDKTTGALSAPAMKAFIRRFYFEGVEKFRELGIEAADDWDATYVLENNNSIPLEKGDKVLLTFEMRWAAPIINTGYNEKNAPVAQVLLYGDSGKVYCLVGGAKNQPYNQWFEVSPSNPDKWFWGGQFNTIGESRGLIEWIIVKNDWLGVEDGNGTYSPGAPESGSVKVRLVHYTTWYGAANGDKKAQIIFRNISFEIKKYSGANILLSTGQWNQITQPGNYFKNESKEIFIDNAPKRIFKGALLTQTGGATTGYGYELAGRVIDGGTTYNTYGAMMARAIWQQVNRVMRTVRGTLGMGFGAPLDPPGGGTTSMPGLIHAYQLEALPGKTFHLLGYEYNVTEAVMNSCTFAEVAPVQAVAGEVVESGFVQE